MLFGRIILKNQIPIRFMYEEIGVVIFGKKIILILVFWLIHLNLLQYYHIRLHTKF